MRLRFLFVFFTTLLIAAPAAGFETEPFTGRGVIRAVRWIEGDVMLQNDDGLMLVALDENAALRDSYGAPITLRELPMGAEVEYIARYWQGLAFAVSLRMTRPVVVGGFAGRSP
ncbi:MAG TPA: hypothetical protein VL754_08760 [Verrucomicrobiae bacterium]|jgi:hypothetical protein|nr:hypothetical protein [Verrucomicrobiae bacterium]